MNPKLLVALALLVLLPLGLLTWLGQRAARGEQARLREGVEALMRGRLAEVQRGMELTIARQEKELSEVLDAQPPDAGTEAWREAARRHRLVSATFVLDARGRMIHPPRDADVVSSEEIGFLQRTDGLWSALSFADDGGSEFEPGAVQGWKVWYHGGGPRFLFWKKADGGSIVGVEVPASVLLAEVMAKLPSEDSRNPGGARGRMAWTDPQGKLVYQWGQSPAGSLSTARLPAPSPFAAWGIEMQAPDLVAAGAYVWRWQWLAGLTAVGLALIGLATYLYRETTRNLRTAAQRITFVNQVSHELKTPLTNITLYAELAGRRLPEDPSSTPARECLDIVVNESARLGRLITNVLTFARHQRGSLRPHTQRFDLDTEMAAILQPYSSRLAESGVRLESCLVSKATVTADTDWLGQIIGNLLSNIEKYAAAGGWAGISTRISADGLCAEVEVADRGPGVPDKWREKIFEPFFRASERLTDGVAGTGLGLGLARELACALGGDLTLSSSTVSPSGCTFILRLPLAHP